MYQNYFKIAWRNLRNHPLISWINLAGLTIGFTCCLLIVTYIVHELSYDRYNTKADRIFRITRTFYNGNGDATLKLATISPPFGLYLPHEFPEIEKMTRFLNAGTLPLRYQDKIVNEQNVFFADENVTDIFTISMISGNPRTALKEPYSVMLTEETARKYFGNADPINRVIRANNQFDLKVTGIYRDFPENAHIHPKVLVSFNTLRDSAIYGEKNLQTNWGNNSFFTYILLPAHFKTKQMDSRFPAFLDKYMTSEYGENTPSKFTSLGLQKLTDIHLHSHTDYEAEPNGDIRRVYIFSIIALFILLIACMNYMNLSTARSALRAREVGIRKVIGANRKELIWQFLSESVILSLVALLLSFLFYSISIPWLNELSGQHLSGKYLLNWKIVIPVLMAPAIVGMLSGIYPAFFLSSFKPIKTLKGVFHLQGKGIGFRKVLVVCQFAISIVLIITTMMVFRQLKFIQNASLGYDQSHIVTLPYFNAIGDKYDAFRNTLLENSAIQDVSRSSRIPTGRLLDANGASVPGTDSTIPVKADIKYVAVDYDFIPTFGITMADGRNFSRNYGTDTTAFIINEAAAAAVGWRSAANAVGQRFNYGGVQGHIIGVMKDFHFESLHEKISPMILTLPPGGGAYNNISVKVSGSNIPIALSTLKKTWQDYLPDFPYQYTFLDENFASMYEAESRQESIFTAFAVIAIFISCLGLLGLSAFAISMRVKEIGIRKVLGADVTSIVTLLSKDFLKLVLIAALIAFPIAWYAIKMWLRDFAYHVAIQWWIFIFAASIALLIAMITISSQAWKAAAANPVKSLRPE